MRLERPEHRARIASEPVVYAVLAVTPASHRLESEVWAEIRSDIVMQAVLLVVLLVLMNVILVSGLRPVHALAHSATRFGRGDLAARMPETRFVEIAPTVAAFNTMAGNVQQREAERREADEALHRAEEQLRQALKMEAVGKLAGGVAHDFNNLLTVILGRCTILLPRLQEGTPVHRGVALIHQTAQRAAGLTRQLLAFSRKQVLKPQALDLTVVVDEIMPMLRRLIGENVELATRLDPGIRRVRADLSQIEQVIVNLAVNARDAMPNGGRLTLETKEVELDAAYVRRHEGARAGPHIQLTVRDTGVGMEAATLPRIFEPFFTTKGPGQGTGLGLSTVYGIVRQSGGSVWVESHAGQGTSFGVCLPVFEEPVATPVEEPAPPVPRGWETVLLVEDEPDLRELAAEILRGRGYAVLEAESPEHAMRVADAYRGTIHLLLTDVVMPGASGRDLADRLTPLRPSMKVLYMSGYTDHAIVHHGVLDPSVAYIPKPFRPDDVARKVREVLDEETVPVS